LDSKLADGRFVGEEAARYAGHGAGAAGRNRPNRERETFSHPYPIVPHPKGKNFIDLDEDVTLADIENACQEGFDNPELLKRYTTVGMGPSQGKLSNLPALRVLNRVRGESMRDKQLTTARPFTSSVKLSHLAGRTFTACRLTPVHPFHEAAGARFMHAGNWLRPEYYQVDGQTREACILKEAKNVRRKVGLIDLSTLGKIEVNGPDAVEFLERIYTGLFAQLKVGMTRYGLMCDESGVVVDDGIIGRLANERYYLSTTTSGSDAVYKSMTRLIMEWGLDVVLTNLTNHFLAMNIAGPLARDVLQQLTDINLGEEAFPFLGLREGRVTGVPARVSRAGFVSELGYEIHLPADGGLRAWHAIMEAGKTYGLMPFGVEAQRLLRLERGHLIVGQDTDGLTQPYEVGGSWAVKMEKPFFVGQRSLRILRKRDLERSLVGFSIASDYAGPLPKECNLVVAAGEIAGRVTSIGKSPTWGHPIGLAYVRPGQSSIGTRIEVRLDDGTLVEATVVQLPLTGTV
jgi:sarcosine oxidase subunit alpha